MVMRGAAENDGYNALVLTAGLGVARRRADPHHLALPAPDPRAVLAGLHVGDAAQARGARARDRRAVPRALRSARPRAHERAAEPRGGDRGATSRTALPAVESLDEDRILRRFVNAVQAAIRTNFYQTRQRRAAEAVDRDQVRQPQARRHAAAAAAVRDLRLFAAGRGRAPALRQGGARRHPLVRPAAGLPHRSPRPREGAAGQERGDRAGRRQGRLRAEAAAGRRLARGDPGRGHRHLQALHLDAARHHRQPRRQRRGPAARTSCATTTTIPIWWSPPTRAPRPSPTSPTGFPRSTVSGSTTRSRRAARPATTTRRWGSRRAAPGKR